MSHQPTHFSEQVVRSGAQLNHGSAPTGASKRIRPAPVGASTLSPTDAHKSLGGDAFGVPRAQAAEYVARSVTIPRASRGHSSMAATDLPCNRL